MKKRGSKIGGDKKTRDKMKLRNPRHDKKGGRTSKQRYKNTGIKCWNCKAYP